MTLPRLELFNRQRAIAFPRRGLLEAASRALPACLRAAREGTPLPRLLRIEAVILSDRAIARVHLAFFNDPAPTDVITFDHGEILLGAGVVARNAREQGEPPAREALRCIVHGLLHLAGWDDATSALRRSMHRRQEAILAAAAPKWCLDTAPPRG